MITKKLLIIILCFLLLAVTWLSYNNNDSLTRVTTRLKSEINSYITGLGIERNATDNTFSEPTDPPETTDSPEPDTPPKPTITRNWIKGTIRVFPKKECDKFYGEVALFSLSTGGDYMKNIVNNALQSVRCYAKMRGYTYIRIVQEENPHRLEGLNDTKLEKECINLDMFYCRHCLVRGLLHKFDYIVHLDADSGVVNPDHCFEEYITPGIDIFHLLRAHSGEVQAGHYIAKNSDFSRQYLYDWYKNNSGVDNRIMHKNIGKYILNITSHETCQDQPTWNWQRVRCLRAHMNGQRVFEHFKFYRRWHSFVHDAWHNDFRWSDQDFMLHAMKRDMDVLYSKRLEPSDCEGDEWKQYLKPKYYVNSIEKMKPIMQEMDRKSVEKRYALESTDISDCWPNCPDNMKPEKFIVYSFPEND